MPADADTVDAKRRFITKWANEYKGLVRNPTGYTKLGNGDWDFDILMDMLFSFFVLTEIPDTHPKVSERLPYAPPSSCAAAPHRPRVAAPRRP